MVHFMMLLSGEAGVPDGGSTVIPAPCVISS